MEIASLEYSWFFNISKRKSFAIIDKLFCRNEGLKHKYLSNLLFELLFNSIGDSHGWGTFIFKCSIALLALTRKETSVNENGSLMLEIFWGISIVFPKRKHYSLSSWAIVKISQCYHPSFKDEWRGTQ